MRVADPLVVGDHDEQRPGAFPHRLGPFLHDAAAVFGSDTVGVDRVGGDAAGDGQGALFVLVDEIVVEHRGRQQVTTRHDDHQNGELHEQHRGREPHTATSTAPFSPHRPEATTTPTGASVSTTSSTRSTRSSRTTHATIHGDRRHIYRRQHANQHCSSDLVAPRDETLPDSRRAVVHGGTRRESRHRGRASSSPWSDPPAVASRRRLSLVSGLEPASEGEVLVEGQPVTGIPDGIGYMFQQDAILPWRTVLDNVTAGPRWRGAAQGRGPGARPGVDRAGRAGRVRGLPPAPAVGGHAQAGRLGPDVDQRAVDPVDGRAVRCARRADPRADAGPAARVVVRSPGPLSCSSPMT